jgi:hypothetical protein
MVSIAPNGSFVGAPGYARGNVLRTSPQFQQTGDPLMVNLLPPASQGTTILPTDDMCKSSQQQQSQTSGSPRLSAAAGSMIALEYQENGHVTLPQNQPGKPSPSRGTVYIYGTTQPKTDEKFLDVFMVWNANGTGGDERGKLLAAMPFDDGRCYQVNGGSISTTRQADLKFQADPVTGTNLWCQNDIMLPTNAPTGQPYTLYWVWDWPTQAGVDPNLPNGKPEIYTTCMDVDITGGVTQQDAPSYSSQPPNVGAVPGYFSTMAQGKNVIQIDTAATSVGISQSAAPVASSATSSSAVSISSALPTSSPAASSAPPANTMTVLVTQTVTSVQTSTSVVAVTQTVIQTVLSDSILLAVPSSNFPSASPDTSPSASPSTSPSVSTGTSLAAETSMSSFSSANPSTMTASTAPAASATLQPEATIPIAFALASTLSTSTSPSAGMSNTGPSAAGAAVTLKPRLLDSAKKARREPLVHHQPPIEPREEMLERESGASESMHISAEVPDIIRSAKFRIM